MPWPVSLHLPTRAAADKVLAAKLENYSLVPAEVLNVRDGGEAGTQCVRWCQLAPVLPFTGTAFEVR